MSSFKKEKIECFVAGIRQEKTHYGVSHFCECMQLETLLLVNEDCSRDISLWRAC